MVRIVSSLVRQGLVLQVVEIVVLDILIVVGRSNLSRKLTWLIILNHLIGRSWSIEEVRSSSEEIGHQFGEIIRMVIESDEKSDQGSTKDSDEK